MADPRPSQFGGTQNRDESFNIFDEESMGNYYESRVPNSGYLDKNRFTNASQGPSQLSSSPLGRSTSPMAIGMNNPQKNNTVLNQLAAPSPYNPYAFPGDPQPSQPPGRVTAPAQLATSQNPNNQVTVVEQQAQIAALKHMVNDYERELGEARATASVRRSAIPGGNHVDTTRDLLNNYEVTINNLKAENLRYQGLDKRVYQLEDEKRQLEQEIDKAQRIKMTLENQLERWQGVDGNLPELKSRCQNLEIENLRYQNEIKKLRTENEFLHLQLRDIERKAAEITKYEQEINKYVLQLRDYENEVLFLKEEKKAFLANERGRQSNILGEVERLKERNSVLETQSKSMVREVDQARSTMGNNNMMQSKMKLLENENEGLKSMMTVNQKMPKNMIFNDNANPAGPVAVDNAAMHQIESQLAIARLEIVRLFEENKDMLKNFTLLEKDHAIIKGKLFKKIGRNVNPGTEMVSNSPRSSQMLSSKFRNPTSDIDNFPTVSQIPEMNRSNLGRSTKPADPGMFGSAMKSAANRQVTFDFDKPECSLHLNKAQGKSNFVSRGPEKKLVRANEGLPILLSDDEDDIPRFGPAQDKSSIRMSMTPGQVPIDPMLASQYPGRSQAPGSPGNPNRIQGSAISTFPIDPMGASQYQGLQDRSTNQSAIGNMPIDPMLASQVPQGNRIRRSVINQSTTPGNMPIDPALASQYPQGRGVEPFFESQYPGQKDQFIGSSSLAQSPRLNGQNAVSSFPIDPLQVSQYPNGNIQKSAIGNQPIDPAMISQVAAILQAQNQARASQSAMNGVPIDPMMASQYPQNMPIDPVLVSQIIANLQQQQQQKSALQQSAIPNMPIDPLLASQLVAQRITANYNGGIQQSAIPGFPIDPLTGSQISGGMKAPAVVQGNNGLPLVLNASQAAGQGGQNPFIKQPMQASQYPSFGNQSGAPGPGSSPRFSDNQGVNRIQASNINFKQNGTSQDFSPSNTQNGFTGRAAGISPHFGLAADRTASPATNEQYDMTQRNLPLLMSNMPNQNQSYVANQYSSVPQQGQSLMGAANAGMYASNQPNSQNGPIVKSLQPIYLPENAYSRNVIFTNDGKQMLIPINGGTSAVKKSAGAMPMTLDQMGVHKFGQSGDSNVKRIVNDSAMRSNTPGKKEFMPLLFKGANEITVSQGQVLQPSSPGGPGRITPRGPGVIQSPLAKRMKQKYNSHQALLRRVPGLLR